MCECAKISELHCCRPCFQQVTFGGVISKSGNTLLSPIIHRCLESILPEGRLPPSLPLAPDATIHSGEMFGVPPRLHDDMGELLR